MLVIFDKKPRKEGVVKYLKEGTNGDRDKKDKRVTLFGNLKLLDRVIKIANEKGYKEAYRNIVLTFSEDNLSIETLEKVANEFIYLYMIPYNPDEYTAYAEAHIPKIKVNSRGEKRKIHIHITTATYSLALDQRLDLGDHSRRLKEIELIKEYLETKYNLQSLNKKRIIQKDDYELFNFKNCANQKVFKEAVENVIKRNIHKFYSFNSLVSTLRNSGIEVKVSKNAKTPYISVRMPPFKKFVRLKGDLFSEKTFTQAKQNLLKNKEYIEIEPTKRSLDEIIKDLKKVRTKRVLRIWERIKNKRQKNKEKEQELLKKIKENSQIKRKIYIKKFRYRVVYQEKILNKLYNYKFINLDLQGFFVKRYTNTGYTLIVNNQRKIKVIDKGDKIVAKGKNLEAEAKIMIEIAIAKGWDLRKIKVTGSDEFKRIVAKIIFQKLKKLENKANKVEVKSEKIDSYINSKLERVNVSGGDGGEAPIDIDKEKEKTDFYPSFKPKPKLK